MTATASDADDKALEKLLEETYNPEGHVSLEAIQDSIRDDGYGGLGIGDATFEDQSFVELQPMRHEGPLTALQEEKQERMRGVLEAMRDDDVTILMLRYVECLTLDELGKELGTSAQAASKRVATAKANFAVAFAENWGG